MTSGLDADLVAFLRARLDEDYADWKSVREWAHRDWYVGEGGNSDTVLGDLSDPLVSSHDRPGLAGSDESNAAILGHIARYDPYRTRLDAEAKLRIVERYERAQGQDAGYRRACLDAIRDLAGVYAGHPEFRGEWRV